MFFGLFIRSAKREIKTNGVKKTKFKLSPFPKSSAQASVEYLLLLAAFFGVMGVIFPVIASSSQQFLEASDVLLAKRIALDIQEKSALLAFLADGSRVELSYFPVKEVSIFSQGTKIVSKSSGKEFFAETNSPQFIVTDSFAGKFKIVISKNQNNVQIIAQDNN